MSDRNHPTIPEIVQALITLNDRHGDELVRLRDEYTDRLSQIDEKVTASMGPLSAFDDGEYAHIEYTLLNSVDVGGYISNMVDIAKSRESLAVKLRELVANPNVYGIFVRRYRSGDGSTEPQGHDREMDATAKLQGRLYESQQALENLTRAHHELEQRYIRLQEEYDAEVGRLEERYDAHGRVVDELFSRIEQAWQRTRKANSDCTYPEPLDIMNLLVGVGNTPTKPWVTKMFSKYLKQVRQETQERKEYIKKVNEEDKG
jgi:hypothetical protein